MNSYYKKQNVSNTLHKLPNLLREKYCLHRLERLSSKKWL